MPPFSFHRPRFLRSFRSSPADARDTRGSHSSGLIPPALSSRSSSNCGSVSERNKNAASHPSSSAHLLEDGEPYDSSDHHALECRPVSSIDITEQNTGQTQLLVAQPHARSSRTPSPVGAVKLQRSLAPQDSAFLPASPSPQTSSSRPRRRPSGRYSPPPAHQKSGMFNQPHDFTAMGTFIEGNVTYNNTASNQFMGEFLKETIPGAAFDSSARDPPPRCHPGTRLAILQRCLDFIGSCEGEKKIRWVVGAAGVGKSAIMQNVAESPNLPVVSQASIFFSINGRDDGTKTIKTLSYQFAAKSAPYRQLVEQEIIRDPSILKASLAVHFKKFIVEPFIHHPELNSAGRVLVIIDGLDECNMTQSQQELLRLISDLCITYPSSPLVWLIASRPESHITSFFSRANVLAAYEKEEILVDADEAREDVERLLRHKLAEIKEASDSLQLHSQWPEEQDLWKIANAAGGLFAYADTVVKYIGDSTIGGPASQLSDVLHVIDNHTMDDVPRHEHPMALLDALYARILSNIPSKVMPKTRKLLLALAAHWSSRLAGESGHIIVLCNWLALTPDEAYAAVNHLRSVLLVPKPNEAHKKGLTPFHKSFIDYISDFNRSSFSRNIQDEAQQVMTECAFRILKEAPDGIDFGDMDYYTFRYGSLQRGPGTGDRISLTWLVDEGAGWNNKMTRLSVYELAVGEVAAGLGRADRLFQSEFCIRLLTSRLRHYRARFFPHDILCDLVFDESRRQMLQTCGILKQMPLKAVNFSHLIRHLKVHLRFRCPATTMTKCSDPWNLSCDHGRRGGWAEGEDQDWISTFNEASCGFCFKRLERQLGSWKIQSRDHAITTLFTSTDECAVEIKFVDKEEGAMSEWTYRIWCSFTLKEQKKYGSTV